MVKGEKKYPQTIASILNFLQYHNKKLSTSTNNHNQRHDLLLVQDSDDIDPKDNDSEKCHAQTKSKPCGLQLEGKCEYKKPHT